MPRWQPLFKNCKSILLLLRQTLAALRIHALPEIDPNLCVPFLNFSYRGYYSRRWEHDFYARKKYLQYVETKNEEVRRNLDDHNRNIAGDE